MSSLGTAARRAVAVLAGLLLVLPALQAVGVAQAHPAAAAAPSASDLRALEQQIAQKINEARMDPQQMSANLLAAKRVDSNHVQLSSGAQFQVKDSFLQASAQEAATQPALPPLGWSETLAKYARDYVYAQNRRGEWNLGHGPGNPSDFLGGYRPPFNVFSIEAITNGDPLDANSFVYRWWTSEDEWKLGSAWKPGSSFVDDVGRGHRGIVNDQRMNAIGVGCGAPFPYSGTTYVACIADDGSGLADVSPATTPAAGTAPSLAGVAGGFTGTLGTTTAPDQGSLTVDTGASAKPTPTTTDAALPGISTPTAAASSGAADTAAAGTCGAVGGATTGDLPFGQWFDTRGDGCFQVTVRAGEEYVPSSSAQIAGTPTAKYRKYQIELVDRTSGAIDGPTAVTASCYSATGQLPLVIDPDAGLSLPTGPVGPGAVQFGVGCGSGADGYARVRLQLSPELGGGALAWFADPGQPTPSAPPAVATSAAGAAAAAGSCPDATTTGLTGTAAATALRCVVDAARAARGLPATLTNDRADQFASLATGTTRIDPANVCSGKPPSHGWAQGQTPGDTPQKAFEAAGGSGNSFFSSTAATYLGIAQADRQYGLFLAVC